MDHQFQTKSFSAFVWRPLTPNQQSLRGYWPKYIGKYIVRSYDSLKSIIFNSETLSKPLYHLN